MSGLSENALHSPLGASSAERWMNCPGSIGLTTLLEESPEAEAPQYRVDGTTAHAGLAHCLENGVEPWEIYGREFDGHGFTPEMGQAVAVFLAQVENDLATADQTFIEEKLRGSLHGMMMGTVDFATLHGDTLKVRDFKYGQGVKVSAMDNPQLLYYAYLLLEKPDCGNVRVVDMAIIQPRAYKDEGDTTWTVSADYVREWGRDVLLPAMLRTGEDKFLHVGEHCRFCPAKLVCPMMRGMLSSFTRLKAEAAVNMSDEELEQWYILIPVVKMAAKAVEDAMMNRAMAGKVFNRTKLVNKSGDRVWKDGARETLIATFGEKNVLSEPHLLSPAAIEKLSPAAKEVVKKLAYSPQTGFTLADINSKKPAVKVQPASVSFADVAKGLLNEEW